MKNISQVIDEQFQLLHKSSLAFIRIVPEELLYKQPRVPTGSMPIYSVGERLLRSAATVEQTFGGLTTNLWDDPFEWTLPESLKTPAAVESYLEEVDRTRERGFAVISSDQDLYKQIALPSGETAELAAVLIAAYGRASHQQGSAFHAFRMLSDIKLTQT
jgi:hypothetical protein